MNEIIIYIYHYNNSSINNNNNNINYIIIIIIIMIIMISDGAMVKSIPDSFKNRGDLWRTGNICHDHIIYLHSNNKDRLLVGIKH